MTIDLNQIVQQIEHLLRQERASPIKSRADIGASELRRKEIMENLIELESAASGLRSRLVSLPDLPNEQIMNWAESILSMRGLIILVLDTTGLDENLHDIIRVHARNIDGVILDQLIKPTRQLHANTLYTGIEWEELIDAPPLVDVWESIIKPALSGQFIISYGLPFVEKMLSGNREYYGLSRLPFRGEDLMKQAKAYFGIDEYGYGSGLKLPDAVERIGKPLPYSPPLAADRAIGCLELLKAMAQGVTSAPSDPLIIAKGDNIPPGGADIVLDVLANTKDHPF